MAKKRGSTKSGIICLVIVFALFGYLGYVMGMAPMLKTVMATAHDLLLNTVFFLMAVCVITGALGRIFVEFGVVSLLEKMIIDIIVILRAAAECLKNLNLEKEINKYVESNL